MEIFEFITYMLAAFGWTTLVLFAWHSTSEIRYSFKLKYILRPKFKKGGYALAPNRHNDPTLVLIKSVSTDWKEKKVEYTVYPVTYSNKHIDYDYFDRLVFVEECLVQIKDYYIDGWEKQFKEVQEG